MSSTRSMNSINPLWIIDLDRKLLQLAGGIFRKAWERRCCPQGCVDVRITDSFSVIMDSVSISSHDIGSDGKYSMGCWVVFVLSWALRKW